jgi:hypothetical protein
MGQKLMTRTMLKPEPRSDTLVWRLYLWALVTTVIGVILIALALAGTTSAAAIAATGSCEIEPETSPTQNPDLVELQRVMGTQARGAEFHGGEAVPTDNVETEVERELGSQYGNEWYEVEAGDFVVGLAAGPISLQQATEKFTSF